MPEEKRRSRRYALAFWFCCDIGDITWYQPTRSGKVPLFTSGNDYYCALRANEKPPEDEFDVTMPWEQIGEAYGYRIMKTTSS